jgi:hypothetical protein
MPDLNKYDRKLEERSHLAIEFPQTNNRVFRTYVPFLENPKISEKGSSNLNEYNLLGRPGSLFSYGGSPSRSFDLTFKISLLHLIQLEATEGISEKFKRSFNLFFSGREMDKKRFGLTSSEYVNFGGGSSGPASRGSPDVEMGKGVEHSSRHRAYYRSLVARLTGNPTTLDDVYGVTSILVDFEDLFETADGENHLASVLDMVYVWVNLIRATTINNSTNTSLGPPTVRLTHGAMYNNVPCVVEDYKIDIIDESGFEIQSLTPKQLSISLSLRENRVGDMKDFKAGSIGSGDNIVGWEAIIDSNNIDPYNGLITLNN